MLLHDLEELDDDLGGRTDQDLALAGLLGVVDAVEGIVENGSADHLDGFFEEILKSGMGSEVSARSMNVSLRGPVSMESALWNNAIKVSKGSARSVADEEKRISDRRLSPSRADCFPGPLRRALSSCYGHSPES